MNALTSLLGWINVLGRLFPRLTVCEFQEILAQLGLTLEGLAALPVRPVDNGGILEFEKPDGTSLWFAVHPSDDDSVPKWMVLAQVHGYGMYHDLGCITRQVVGDILTLVRNTCTDQEEIVAP